MSAFTRLWTYLTYNFFFVLSTFTTFSIKMTLFWLNWHAIINQSIFNLFWHSFLKINWGWQTFPKLKLSPIVGVTIISLYLICKYFKANFYCSYYGMGQHRKQSTEYTDLVCMVLSCEVCSNQRVTPIDPKLTLQREITFVNVRVVCGVFWRFWNRKEPVETNILHAF